jgi:hypothetical protein
MRDTRRLLSPIALLVLLSLSIFPTVSCRLVGEDEDQSTVTDIVDRIAEKVEATIRVATEALLVISRLSYSLMVFLGTFLYLTRLNKRLGRDLVLGGVGLVLLFEILEPVLL